MLNRITERVRCATQEMINSSNVAGYIQLYLKLTTLHLRTYRSSLARILPFEKLLLVTNNKIQS
jgi:hypothetical protein